MKPIIPLVTVGLAVALSAPSARAADAPTATRAAAAAPAYLEFTVRDEARAKAFYGAVFNWTFTDYDPTYTNFTAAGGVSGGFLKGVPSRSGGGPLMVFPVVDLEAAAARVTAAGGKITRPIFAYPGGRRFHFRDLDGYEVAAWSEH
jgi:predicted enzyme related to lactoylglutathione lyase